jgi:hypothetical protein
MKTILDCGTTFQLKLIYMHQDNDWAAFYAKNKIAVNIHILCHMARRCSATLNQLYIVQCKHCLIKACMFQSINYAKGYIYRKDSISQSGFMIFSPALS